MKFHALVIYFVKVFSFSFSDPIAALNITSYMPQYHFFSYFFRFENYNFYLKVGEFSFRFE